MFFISFLKKNATLIHNIINRFVSFFFLNKSFFSFVFGKLSYFRTIDSNHSTLFHVASTVDETNGKTSYWSSHTPIRLNYFTFSWFFLISNLLLITPKSKRLLWSLFEHRHLIEFSRPYWNMPVLKTKHNFQQGVPFGSGCTKNQGKHSTDIKNDITLLINFTITYHYFFH